MNWFLKIFFYIVLIVGLVYGGNWAYNKWWGGGDELAKKAKEITENLGGQAQNYAKESAEKIKESVEKKAQETIQDYSKKAMVSAVSFVKDKIDALAQSVIGTPTALNSIISDNNNYVSVSSVAQNNSGVIAQSTSSVFFIPPPPTAIVTQAGKPLVFSINKAAIYAVDWGDGSTGGGENKTAETKLVEHIWTREGDYNAQIIMKEGEKTNIYSFPVRVYQ